jgi:hypothetical protein
VRVADYSRQPDFRQRVERMTQPFGRCIYGLTIARINAKPRCCIAVKSGYSVAGSQDG